VSASYQFWRAFPFSLPVGKIPLRTLFCPCFASSTAVALAHFFRHGIFFGDDLPSSLWSNRCTIHIPQLIRAVFGSNHQDPIQQVSGDSADGLGVVLSLVHHLIVIDAGQLRVEAPGSLGVQEGKLLDQIGSSLADMQTFRFAVGALLAVRHHAAPAAQVAPIGKAQWITDVAQENRCTLFPDPIQGMQVA